MNQRNNNGCRIYVDGITGEKLSSIKVVIHPAFIGRAVYPVGGKEDGVKGVGEIVILAPYRVHFVIEHDNLV